MPINRRINANPILSTYEPPHQQVVPLCAFFVVAVSHKVVPCYSFVTEAVERKDLCANVFGLVVSCFDEKDRVACTREIGGDCACEAVSWRN
jgi:hypothetical protein